MMKKLGDVLNLKFESVRPIMFQWISIFMQWKATFTRNWKLTSHSCYPVDKLRVNYQIDCGSASSSDLIIKKIGQSLFHILPELVGQNISQVFDLIRPLIDFKFTSVSYQLLLILNTIRISVIIGLN